MAERGAQAALRGYRLQALYTLDRIFDSTDAQVFWLEGHEDLTILSSEATRLEVIQIKARTEPLTLGVLKPGKEDSFFRRVLKRREPSARELLVSFGPLGSTMSMAWQGDDKERDQTVEQFEKWGYNSEDTEYLLGKVELCTVVDDELQARVYARLRESPVSGDPQSAFELLLYWLYREAENKARITQRDLLDRLAVVGRYLAARAAHHQEWYTTIIPLDGDSVPVERDRLATEFYQGIDAQYEHIVAEVDVHRPALLARIDDAFNEARVVVVRGASGQGKSTLAYRYLHDYVPSGWRFEVRRIQDRRHAANIALALRETLEAIGAPAVVYIDVEPQATAWRDLVQELTRLSLVRVLITIREEDWRQATLSRAIVRWQEVEVDLAEDEAREIYEQLARAHPPVHVLGFTEAWRRFGGDGPLLEFTYLVTQDSTLEDRLSKQITRLHDDVRLGRRTANELELLRCVSIAAAYGARLDLQKLACDLHLAAPTQTVERFEREHLLRIGEKGRILTGLHAIRSELLARLLTKDEIFEPWASSAARALRAMEEEDLEVFLLHAFAARRSDTAVMVETLNEMRPETWTGTAGIVLALLWLGVSQYIEANESLIRELHDRFGDGWWMILMPDIGGIETFAPGLMQPLFAGLAPISDEDKRSMAAYRARLTETEHAWSLARVWLSTHRWPASKPRDALDWQYAAQVILWAYHLGLDEEPGLPLPPETIAKALDELPLETSADLVFAFSLSKASATRAMLEHVQPRLLERFRRETRTPVVEDDGRRICAHFLVNPSLFAGSVDNAVDKDSTTMAAEETSKSGEYDLNKEAVYRVNLLRRIVPQRQRFGSQGYGHQVVIDLVGGFDETTKDIPAVNLPPAWPQALNVRFLRLGSYLFRSDEWHDYSRQVLTARQANIAALEQLADGLKRYRHKRTKRNPVRLFGTGGQISQKIWESAQTAIQRLPKLPRSAVDEWGLVTEGMVETSGKTGTEAQIKGALSLARHGPYIKAIGDVFTPLKGFYHRSERLLIALEQEKDPQRRAAIRDAMRKQGIPENDAHVLAFNLANSLRALPSFQKEFRERFAGFFNIDELDALAREEDGLLRRVMVLWHNTVVAPAPAGMTGGAGKEAKKRLDEILSQVRTKLQKKLRSLAREGIRASIYSERVPWDDQSALWLVCDIDEIERVQEAIQRVYQVVKETLPCHSWGANVTLPYLTVYLAWSTIHIVPWFRGRAVNRVSRYCSMTALMFASENDQNAPGGQAALPDETWSALDIPAWSDPLLDLGERLTSAMSRAWILLLTLARLGAVPEGDAVAREIVGEYKAELTAQLLESLRLAADAAIEMTNHIDVPIEELGTHWPQLAELFDLLMHVQPILEDSLDEDSEEMDRRSEQLLSIPALLSGLSNRWNTYVVEMLSGKPDIAAQE